MFDSEKARKRVDAEKALFDYARMFLTIIAMIGATLLLFKGTENRDPITEMFGWMTAVPSAIFTAYLLWRFFQLSEDLSQIYSDITGTTWGRVRAIIFGMGLIALTVAITGTLGLLLEEATEQQPLIELR